MNDQQAVNALGYLCRIVEAGERGYAVSAANLDSPGLKLLFKSFAQQRAKFKNEILAEIQRLGGNTKLRSSIRGIIHRGRIDIFAALTIGKTERERVVLKEVMLGEKAALHAYEKTMKEILPAETRQMVSKQYEHVQQLVDQIHLILGTSEKRMLVRLFDTEEDTTIALRSLDDLGCHPTKIEQINFHNSLELYEGRGTTVLETSVSGAVGGALWGGLVGGLAGLGAQQTAGLVPIGEAATQSAWPFISLLIGIVAGALFGAFLGFVIGIGISEEDNYSHEQSMKHGQILLLTTVENSQAHDAQQIIAQLKPVHQVDEATG